MRSFAISDIHGCLETFRTLLFDRLQLTKADRLYLLGDYIDRGPSSKGVLDFMMQLEKDGYDLQCIRGNHDHAFYRLSVEYSDAARENWEIWGGTETLVSFEAYDKVFNSIPSRYFEYINQMDYYLKTKDHLLVHAGFDFSSEDIFEQKIIMMWARTDPRKVNIEKLQGRTLVHGHTPMTKEKIIEQVTSGKYPVICIDAGCCYKDRPGMGYLCALQLENHALIFEPRVDEIHGEYD